MSGDGWRSRTPPWRAPRLRRRTRHHPRPHGVGTLALYSFGAFVVGLGLVYWYALFAVVWMCETCVWVCVRCLPVVWRMITRWSVYSSSGRTRDTVF